MLSSDQLLWDEERELILPQYQMRALMKSSTRTRGQTSCVSFRVVSNKGN